MVNLTKVFETTKHLVDSGDIVSPLRPYLGMSGLGHSCSRYLWYSFRWAYEERYSKRLARLFARGHREEPILDKMYRAIGYNINPPYVIEDLCKLPGVSWDAESNQLEMTYGFGHVKGHCDGIITNVIEAPKTIHLSEYKTASDAKFKGYKKKNDLKKSHQVYYGQTQLYMNFLKLTRTLWTVVNKNDDDIHIERIHYNRDDAELLLRKADSVLMATFPPRQAFIRTYFECKWCSAKDTCWNGKPMERNCRTCKYVAIAHEGQWECDLNGGVNIPLDFQRKGCDNYSAIEQ